MTSCPYYLLFRSCESPLRPSLEVASLSVRLVECCVSISEKIGDPSSRTKGFSYSLARTDGALALDAIPAALMLHQSAVEALRECEDAMTGD
jgi:hypothetical protein